MARRLSTKEKMRSLVTVTGSAVTVFTGFCLYQGNEKFYNQVVMPVVQLVDPEVSHKIAVSAVKWGLVSGQKFEDPKSLQTSVWGLRFNNPVGMAAGFDKQAEAVRGLHKLGFGFVEIGSVTPEPQPGNPKPRVFRLAEDNAIINRYGFNSDGYELVSSRLRDLKNDPNFNGTVGVNLGKNKISEDPVKDYVEGVKQFSDVADYFVINVSSPNTPGLRDLQNKKNLENLLTKVNDARKVRERKPPLLLKLSPDLTESEQEDIVQVIGKPKSKVDGLVISNTTIRRPGLTNSIKNESGGLSGAPLKTMSTNMIASMYNRTHGKVPIIGVGGIFSGEDAYEKIKSGASLVQIYTSYIYHGPPVINRIKKELNDLLQRDGFSTIADAVGKHGQGS